MVSHNSIQNSQPCILKYVVSSIDVLKYTVFLFLEHFIRLYSIKMLCYRDFFSKEDASSMTDLFHHTKL